jgi:thiol peroxidase
MVDGQLAGLLARAIGVIDPDGKVAYSQLVSEIKTEPDYEAALKAIK